MSLFQAALDDKFPWHLPANSLPLPHPPSPPKINVFTYLHIMEWWVERCSRIWIYIWQIIATNNWLKVVIYTYSYIQCITDKMRLHTVHIYIIYTILALKRTHCVYRYWVGFPPHWWHHAAFWTWNASSGKYTWDLNLISAHCKCNCILLNCSSVCGLPLRWC